MSFETVGFFEEVWDEKLRVCLGTQVCPEQVNRPLGIPGEVFFEITQPLTITKGHKTYLVKASARKPRKLFTRYFRLCGRYSNSGIDKSPV